MADLMSTMQTGLVALVAFQLERVRRELTEFGPLLRQTIAMLKLELAKPARPAPIAPVVRLVDVDKADAR